jgi:hypothetical protein
LGLPNIKIDVCFDETLILNPLESDLSEAQLRSAANVWNDALGRQILVVSSFLPSDIDVHYVDEIPSDRYPDAHGLAFSGWNDDGTFRHCGIVILEGTLTVNLLAHELGHCMGLRHDDSDRFPQSIMKPYVSYNDVPQFHHLLHLARCPLTRAEEVAIPDEEDASTYALDASEEAAPDAAPDAAPNLQ